MSDSKITAPVAAEYKNLLSEFELFLTQRRIGRPVSELQTTVQNMRILIGKIITRHFVSLPPQEELEFTEILTDGLTGICQDLSKGDKSELKYYDYCIAEILLCFEWAQQIKAEAGDLVTQKIMLQDIPILRPFDYGLRAQFRVISRPTPSIVKK
jgi:hypothetical protein